jgi:hypothetical protein
VFLRGKARGWLVQQNQPNVFWVSKLVYVYLLSWFLFLSVIRKYRKGEKLCYLVDKFEPINYLPRKHVLSTGNAGQPSISQVPMVF